MVRVRSSFITMRVMSAPAPRSPSRSPYKSEIKGAARGNEQNREYCVDRIRVLIEHFVRELHLSLMGIPAPSQYDRATAAQLLPLFQTIAGTTPQEHVGLRDTVRFCDP